MKKELDYFWVGDDYGGRQSKLPDLIMRHAGCAAVTACDSCIYMKLYKDKTSLCPFSSNQLKGKEYTAFFQSVKPYLRPRLMGIDRLDIYISGFEKFLREHGQDDMEALPWPGDRPLSETIEAVKGQIEQGFPIPILLLQHQNPNFEDYVWHWFQLTGYDERPNGRFLVKAVTYGSYEWLDLDKLWNTGYEKKGGLILFREKPGRAIV